MDCEFPMVLLWVQSNPEPLRKWDCLSILPAYTTFWQTPLKGVPCSEPTPVTKRTLQKINADICFFGFLSKVGFLYFFQTCT